MPPNAQDASGAIVDVPRHPSRIISLVPSVTETLFALGLGSLIVGITEWCIHPAAALAGLPRVKGTKNPNIAAIEALRPDLVIANLEENREIDVRRMRESGICVWVDFPCTVPEVADHVRWLAALGPSSDEAGSLVHALESAARRPSTTESTRRCFLAVWKDPWMTISSATYAHDLLARLGLANVFASSGDRYPRVTLEQIRDADPEVILLPDEPYSFTEADADRLRADLSSTNAGQSGRVHVVDGTLAFWHGPRTVRALTEGLLP